MVTGFRSTGWSSLRKHRLGHSQHDALDALAVGLRRRKVNWVLDLDVRGFFDNVSHEWLVKFIEHRIADRRVVRLIQKWLKAGVSVQVSRATARLGRRRVDGDEGRDAARFGDGFRSTGWSLLRKHFTVALRRFRRFGGKWRALGWRRCGVAVSGIACRGSGSARSSINMSRHREFCIQSRVCALTPNTRGKSRMR